MGAWIYRCEATVTHRSLVLIQAEKKTLIFQAFKKFILMGPHALIGHEFCGYQVGLLQNGWGREMQPGPEFDSLL
jgi:hypothetical protein